MIRLTPAMRIAFGLVSLTTSLLLFADLFGLIPNRGEGILDARKKLCESLAVQMSVAASRSDHETLRMTLETLVGRNQDVHSAALRAEDGTIVEQVGGHEQHWRSVVDGHSTGHHVQVPIFQREQHWGNVEVSFAAPTGGYFKDSVYALVVFVGLLGFLGYFYVLRKAMRELDPSSVVPERVKTAFNSLTEGLLVLDEKEQIVLANDAFAKQVGRAADTLIGHRASELDWYDEQRGAVGLPWRRTLSQGQIQTAVPLSPEYRRRTEASLLGELLADLR